MKNYKVLPPEIEDLGQDKSDGRTERAEQSRNSFLISGFSKDKVERRQMVPLTEVIAKKRRGEGDMRDAVLNGTTRLPSFEPRSTSRNPFSQSKSNRAQAQDDTVEIPFPKPLIKKDGPWVSKSRRKILVPHSFEKKQRPAIDLQFSVMHQKPSRRDLPLPKKPQETIRESTPAKKVVQSLSLREESRKQPTTDLTVARSLDRAMPKEIKNRVYYLKVTKDATAEKGAGLPPPPKKIETFSFKRKEVLIVPRIRPQGEIMTEDHDSNSHRQKSAYTRRSEITVSVSDTPLLLGPNTSAMTIKPDNEAV